MVQTQKNLCVINVCDMLSVMQIKSKFRFLKATFLSFNEMKRKIFNYSGTQIPEEHIILPKYWPDQCGCGLLNFVQIYFLFGLHTTYYKASLRLGGKQVVIRLLGFFKFYFSTKPNFNNSNVLNQLTFILISAEYLKSVILYPPFQQKVCTGYDLNFV